MRGKKTRPKVKPPCQKKGKTRYGFRAAQRLSVQHGWRFYFCPSCRAHHRTTHEPGVAGVPQKKKD